MKSTSLQALHNLSCVNKSLRLAVLQELEEQKDLYPRLVDQAARMKGNIDPQKAMLYGKITWFLHDVYKSSLCSVEDLQAKKEKSETDKTCLFFAGEDPERLDEIRSYAPKLFLLTNTFYCDSYEKFMNDQDFESVANSIVQKLSSEMYTEGLATRPESKRANFEEKYGQEFREFVEKQINSNVIIARNVGGMSGILLQYDDIIDPEDYDRYPNLKAGVDFLYAQSKQTEDDLASITQNYSDLMTLLAKMHTEAIKNKEEETKEQTAKLGSTISIESGIEHAREDTAVAPLMNIRQPHCEDILEEAIQSLHLDDISSLHLEEDLRTVLETSSCYDDVEKL